MIHDISRVFTEHWQVILGLLLLIAFCQVLIHSIFKIIFGNRLTTADYVSLGMTGWIVPAFMLSLLWLVVGYYALVIFILAAFLLCRFKSDPEPASKTTSILLLLLVSISIPLRLVFVSETLLPLYFDSAQHYMLIEDLLEGNLSNVFTLTRYYHQGFHTLVAFATQILQADIAKTMLVLGQLTLAVMPASVFFLVHQHTKSAIAGIFVVVLAAWGWSMPAHAVDWGKYPALTSLALIPFVLSLMWLVEYKQNELPRARRWSLYLLLFISILICGVAHSRSLIVLGIILLSWVMVTRLQKTRHVYRISLFSILVIVMALEIFFIQRQSVFAPLFDPYLHKGIWITLLVLFLTGFALKEFPVFVSICLLAICLLFASLFVPVRWLPGYENLTLLDRPFVEMILYLPFSLLGGLGLAGFERQIPPTSMKMLSQRASISLMAISLVLLRAFVTYDLYPSACCMIVGNDDAAALAWMDDQLSVDARIGIASTELNVLPSESVEGYAGSDAGIWITPLIDRVTVPLPQHLDFEQEDVLAMLCEMGIDNIYIGELGLSFDNSKLSRQSQWYKPILVMPGVKVYEMAGCMAG